MERHAGRDGWQRLPVRAGEFTLHTLQRPPAGPGRPLHIYLAGDGRPWQGRQPASNPTGGGSLVLDLLLADTAPALYLGRPCYHQEDMGPECRPELWTSERYSPEILDTLVAAGHSLLEKHRPRELVLIGHSGGGVLAVLLGERLAVDRPVLVITLGANLDTRAWTDFHGHLPLTGSINPSSRPGEKPGLGRVHWQGQMDTVVPPQVNRAYRATHPDAVWVELENCGHSDCWRARWPQLVKESRGLLP